MTISSTTRTAGPYAGTGVQQIFSFAFKVFVNTDMLVVLTNNTTGNATVMNLTSDYTVSLNADQNANPGGTITMLVAPVVGVSLSITSQVPLLQPTDIANVGNFYPKAVTDAFDRACIQIQQQGGSIGSTVRGTLGEVLTTLPPAATRAGNVLAFDSLGQPVLMVPPSGSGTALAVSLADTVNPANGAGLVGRATRQVMSLAELRTVAGRYANDMICLERVVAGYNRGGGQFVWDSASVLADDGVTVIAVTGVPTGRWLRLYSFLTPCMFGAKAAPGFDNTTAFAALVTFLNARAGNQPKVLFEEGRYEYTTSPNWAINYADINPAGAVYLRNTGTGHSVIIDGGPTTGGVIGLKMGNERQFIVEGSASSQDGVYVRSILQGSHIGFQINGAGTTYSGMNIEFGVCAQVDVTCSNNAQGFTWYSRPTNGLKLNRRGAGELASYLYFPNPILEGVSGSCALLDWAQGNVFMGGTMEGSASVGMNLTGNAIKNKVFGTDFEANVNHDIYCQGRGNEFYGVNTETQVTFDTATSVINKVFGGTHNKVLVTATTIHNLLSGITYNQDNAGWTITDLSGGRVRYRDNYNQGIGNFENTPLGSPVVIGVGASPFSYQNLGDNEQMVMVAGGTVTGISITRNGVNKATSVTAGNWTLSPNDILIVTYTGAPAMTQYNR